MLVLHGGVNRALLSHEITAGGRAFFGHLSQATGCINALDVGSARGEVRNTTMELLYAQYMQYKADDAP